MHIAGGSLRGRRLAVPAGGTRPTAGRVREALFNMLEHASGLPPLDGARVLDLFAGSGALALEALSRGAAFALCVEQSPQARDLVRANARGLGLEQRVRVLRRDATRLGKKPASLECAFDLVFCDPPYGKALGAAALTAARRGGWLAPGAAAAWEEDAAADIAPPPGFALLIRRRHGGTQLLILRLLGE